MEVLDVMRVKSDGDTIEVIFFNTYLLWMKK